MSGKPDLKTLLTGFSPETFSKYLDQIPSQGFKTIRGLGEELSQKVDQYLQITLESILTNPPAGPLPLQEIIQLHQTTPAISQPSSSLEAPLPLNAPYEVLSSLTSSVADIWRKEAYINFGTMPKGPYFKRADLENLQQVAQVHHQTLQDNALQNFWPKIRFAILRHNIHISPSKTPEDTSSAEEIRAYLCAEENQAAIQKVKKLVIGETGWSPIIVSIPSSSTSNGVDLPQGWFLPIQLTVGITAHVADTSSTAHIRVVPLEVNFFKQLETLHIAEQELTSFPKLQLPNLKTLVLDGNKLTELPPIETMPQLQCLSVSKNPIYCLNDPHNKNLLITGDFLLAYNQDVRLFDELDSSHPHNPSMCVSDMYRMIQYFKQQRASYQMDPSLPFSTSSLYIHLLDRAPKENCAIYFSQAVDPETIDLFAQLSPSEQDQILGHIHLSNEEETHFSNRAKFYAAVHNTLLWKYWELDTTTRALVQKRIWEMELAINPDDTQWNGATITCNLPRLAIAMAEVLK